MGATKNDLINQQVKDSPIHCPDCKYNYNDHFFELCKRHAFEYERHEAECRAFNEALAQENGIELESYQPISGAIK